MSDRLPPDVTTADIDRHFGANFDHKHEWVPVAGSPVIEDGAAVFHEECNYAEGQYGQGRVCQAERTYRFEYSHLEKSNGVAVPVPTIGNWGEASDELLEKVAEIEEAYHTSDAETDLHVDPDQDDGQVEIAYDGYVLVYQPT